MKSNIDKIEVKIIKCHHNLDDEFQYNITSTGPYIYDLSFYAKKYFTGNCQLFSIARIGDVIKKFKKDDILLIFNKVFKDIEKSIALIDIKEEYYESLLQLDIIDKEIIILFNTSYVSTNGSDMRIIGFKLNK